MCEEIELKILNELFYMGHSFKYRTDLKKKKIVNIPKSLKLFLWHLFINLIDTCIPGGKALIKFSSKQRN